MLGMLGIERLMKRANAQILDSDRDAGGERKLLRMRLPGEEDIVCLQVICPSTQADYIIQVPPWIRECQEGGAWIAGLNEPTEYRPLLET